jgi:hypothetical protein
MIPTTPRHLLSISFQKFNQKKVCQKLNEQNQTILFLFKAL